MLQLLNRPRAVMGTFRKLKKIKTIFSEIPGIKTYKDFDILIEIGYHQEIDQPLTLKQLLLLEISSRATVCRHLDKMVADGMVIKRISSGDQRSVELLLDAKAVEMLANKLAIIAAHFNH